MTTHSRAARDSRDFRNALGHFGTGVAVITTRDTDGRPYGLTATSFNSVSLDPPLIRSLSVVTPRNKFRPRLVSTFVEFAMARMKDMAAAQ